MPGKAKDHCGCQVRDTHQQQMSSYNKLNGLHASEDPHLLRDILRGDFLFDGMVMSDWGGTYSGGEAIAAGMDLEMPGPSMMRGSPLEREIVSGKLDPADLDACVLNVRDACFTQLISRCSDSSMPPSSLGYRQRWKKVQSIPLKFAGCCDSLPPTRSFCSKTTVVSFLYTPRAFGLSL